MTQKHNLNVVSGLARIMAGENLNVIHDVKMSTASFNIEKRILKLPMLKEMTGYMYHAFVAHEVGHAIYTPYDDSENGKKLLEGVPSSYVNITEDARIEKLIKRKYPGTIKDFHQFYQNLASSERDFFGIKGKVVTELTLIDRINLYFKIGHIIKIPFTTPEVRFVDMVDNEITFEDAVAAAQAIHKFMSEKKEEKKSNSLESDINEEKESDNTVEEEKESPIDNVSSSSEEKESDNTVETQSNFDKNISEKLVEISKQSTFFGEIKRFDKTWKSYIKKIEIPSKNVDKTEYLKFLNSISSTVNMMSSYFNMKKAGKNYQRTQISKTGKLNVDKLSNYRTSSDIFLKNEILNNEQNHGMIMYLDWSGSMSSDILSTIKQLIVLLEFCKKTHIPFEVYGFTFSSPKNTIVPQENIISPDMNLSLFKLFSSEDSHFQFRNTSAYIFNQSKIGKTRFICPMSGTPINSAAVISEYIIKDFKKKFNCDKNIFLLLSDGGSNDSVFLGKTKIINYVKSKVILKDSQTGKNYVTCSDLLYRTFFEYIKEKCEVSKMIGIYLSMNFDNYIHTNICMKKGDFQTNKYSFNNKKYLEIDSNSPFDKYFIIDVLNFDLGVEHSLNGISPYSTKKTKDFKIKKFLSEKTKPMIFLRSFVDIVS